MSQRFYAKAAAASQDVGVRKLLGDLAIVEKSHGEKASALSEAILTESARDAEGKTAHRFFVLQYVQPGLAGLMDGSVSTLAPLFAAAFATQNNWSTFLVGLAASLGAGISMGFRRGPVRRRLDHRTRRALDPRRGLRLDDHRRRPRP